MLGYLVAALGIGVIYLIKYAEFNLWWGTMADNTVNANTWISSGTAFEVTSSVMGEVSRVVDSFNTFMEDIAAETDDCGLIDEFKTTNPTTGLRELRDLQITLPNGLTLVVISGKEVQDFRISTAAFDFKGAILWEHQFGNYAQNCVCIAMRLTADPTYEFLIPGTTDFNFIDPATGLVKKGSECVPIQGIKDTDALNLATAGYAFVLICNFLKAMGFDKTLSAWWQRYVLRRSFSKVRDKIQDLSEVVLISQTEIALVKAQLDELTKDLYGNPSRFINRLRELGYHPY